jgi:hypothetical protein
MSSASVSPEIIEDYWRLFVNRTAYTVQSKKPHPTTGRYYYFRPREKRTGAPLELTAETIRRHLLGELTIGLYTINPFTQRCKWLAVDADYQKAMDDLNRLQARLVQDGVSPALETSRRGGHLWMFFATPLLAKQCRAYIHGLARKLGLSVKGAGSPEGIEVFPKHDSIARSGFGSALRGPLGVHRAVNRRFWFCDAASTTEAQIAYLKRLPKVAEHELPPVATPDQGESVSSEPASSHRPERARMNAGMGFRILTCVGITRQSGRNYLARCPSCARSGHDRTGDNLAVQIDDPRFYKCWAGCSKQMIRAALGYPIGMRSPRARMPRGSASR